MLLDKKLNYGKFVKEEYLPPRSYKKMEELSEIKSKLQAYNKKKMAFRDDIAGDIPIWFI